MIVPDSLTAGSVHHLLQAADRQQREEEDYKVAEKMADDNLYFSNEQHRTLPKRSAGSVSGGEMRKSFESPGTTGNDSACQELSVLYWTFGRSECEFRQEVEGEERWRGQQ